MRWRGLFAHCGIDAFRLARRLCLPLKVHVPVVQVLVADEVVEVMHADCRLFDVLLPVIRLVASEVARKHKCEVDEGVAAETLLPVSRVQGGSVV